MFVMLFFVNFSYKVNAYQEPGILEINNKLAKVTVNKIKDLYKKLAEEL